MFTVAAIQAGAWPELTMIFMALGIGYLFGSIPFGLLLTRWAGLDDIRSIGSGNIGATNVLRTGSKKLAVATLLADILKGLLPVLLISTFTAPPLSASLAAYAGLGAFGGHLYPIWLKFRGGKGVATFIGVLLGLAPWLGGLFILLWLGTAWLFRISSLAALIATFTITLLSAGFSPAFPFILIMALLLFWRHRENIIRLLHREESKIGKGK